MSWGGFLQGLNTAANVASGVGGFFGGGQEGLSRADQRFMAHKAWNLADDQFYRGMQIRAADAEKAGLHPLAAMGVMPSGVSLGVVGAPESKPSLGDRLNNMGQNLSRAISAYQTPEQRALFRQQLDNEKAQGDLLRAQAAESAARTALIAGTPPPAPPSGDLRNPKPKYIAYRNQDGTISYHYNPEFAASIMSDPFQMYGQSVRNIFRSSETGGFPWQGTWNEIKASAKRLSPLRWFDWRR